MGTLVTRCKQRCDLENDEHIPSAEWKSLISEQYGDLWSIVAAAGLRYWETESTITATGAASYAEPDDHLATVGLDFVDSAGHRRPLDEIMVQERHRWIGLTGEAFAYALVDDAIVLYPKPASGTYKLLYIPQPPDLSAFADGDAVDVVTPDGESFLLWGTAVKALAKSETDVNLAMAEREQARVRLQEWANMRSFNQPRRRIVRDGFADYDPIDPSGWWNR